MAVPKKRKSKSRTAMRRSQHDKLAAPSVSFCPNCGEPKLPHRVCLTCGQFKGESVLTVVEYD